MIDVLIGSVVFTGIVLALTLAVIGARAALYPAGDATVSVNAELTVHGRRGRKLLGVLTDGGIPVPSACAGAGTCGLCRVTITAGGGEVLPTEAARLTRGERRAGLRLACQVVVRDDMAVDVPATLLAARTWDCTVRSSRTLSPLIKELVLALPEGEAIDFRPGGYVQITAPPLALSFADIQVAADHEPTWRKHRLRDLTLSSESPQTRAYSIANTPAERDCLVLLVRLALPPPGAAAVSPGVVSSYLFGLRPGDRVGAVGPYGEFYVRDTDRELVMIGGGVGMAPLRAMISDLLRAGSDRRLTLWYGARSFIDLFYVEELDSLAATHPNFGWTAALSDPQPEDSWTGRVGFIHDVAQREHIQDHPAPETCDYYLCGPPLMISAVLAMLDDAGVDRESIFIDEYGS